MCYWYLKKKKGNKEKEKKKFLDLSFFLDKTTEHQQKKTKTNVKENFEEESEDKFNWNLRKYIWTIYLYILAFI